MHYSPIMTATFEQTLCNYFLYHLIYLCRQKDGWILFIDIYIYTSHVLAYLSILCDQALAYGYCVNCVCCRNFISFTPIMG